MVNKVLCVAACLRRVETCNDRFISDCAGERLSQIDNDLTKLRQKLADLLF